jgi:HAD superfamily hydrolase (TIGR01509 family)
VVNPIQPAEPTPGPTPDRPPDRPPDPAHPVRYVLFDFDGPLVRLFAGHPAPGVAHRLLGDRDGGIPAAGLGFSDRTDPHRVLLELGGLLAAAPSLPEAEAEQLASRISQALTAEECRAAGTAVPTPGADLLVDALERTGCRLAITSNNAPEAIFAYLAREQASGIAAAFREHVYGRSPDPRLMKPDPDCVRRALKGLRCEDPRQALLIGDSPSDYQAATAAGVRFLGFAPTERGALRLRAAKVPVTVGHADSLRRVLALFSDSPQRRNGSESGP